MILTISKLPDFKTRLINLQKTHGENIPGFSEMIRDNNMGSKEKQE
jgi:hypothetical protein